MTINSLRPIRTEDVEWEIVCEPESTPLEGNVLASGDDDEDAAAEEWVRDQLDSGNEWSWCIVRVVGRWRGLTEWECLGGCSYRSEEDFKEGGYYEDMRSEVLRRLQETASNVAEYFFERLDFESRRS